MSGRFTPLAARLPTGILLLVPLGAAAFPCPADYGEGPLLAQTGRLGQLESI